MADSEMVRYPEAWMVDFLQKPKWNYTPGLEHLAFQKVYDKTGVEKYWEYSKSYADTMLVDNGQAIITYKLEKYNIDHINPGKILFPLYQKTKEEKYKNAINLLRNQMLTHPRTSEGSFWHKQIYPHQVWLDGIYMACPFLAEYALTFDEPTLFDDIALQIIDVHKHMYDPITGLYYHGWDESREQRWSNPETGLSPHFWSRSIGWYMMAIVDVLDFMPADHPKREEIISILQNLSVAIEKFQDSTTGMWYQITDLSDREGNYQESSGSIMFIYTWVKGAQKGYLDASFLKKGETAYNQFIDQFIRENEDGTIRVTDCCSVAGLGGEKVYRDGSFEYYIGEPVRDNDPKTIGPFIMVSVLLDK